MSQLNTKLYNLNFQWICGDFFQGTPFECQTSVCEQSLLPEVCTQFVFLLNCSFQVAVQACGVKTAINIAPAVIMVVFVMKLLGNVYVPQDSVENIARDVSNIYLQSISGHLQRRLKEYAQATLNCSY